MIILSTIELKSMSFDYFYWLIKMIRIILDTLVLIKMEVKNIGIRNSNF